MPMIVAVGVLIWLTAACAFLAFVYRKAIADAWNEPVLRVPILILESDDWGFGSPEQASLTRRHRLRTCEPS